MSKKIEHPAPKLTSNYHYQLLDVRTGKRSMVMDPSLIQEPMAKKTDGTKPDSTGPVQYVSRYPVSFPVSHFGDMKLTLDGKKEIPGDNLKYAKYIEKAGDLSPEEVMYLVNRVIELETFLNTVRADLKLYE